MIMGVELILSDRFLILEDIFEVIVILLSRKAII